MQLTETELSTLQQTLRDYAPAQDAIATLLDRHGDLDSSLETLLAAKTETATFGDRSLKQITLEVLREQLCGDDGFRQKLKDYLKDKESTPLLTGAIVYVASKVVLPFPIDPALATIIILYVSKIGIEIFCRYTEPEQKSTNT
jgi:hypothetical protein